MLNVVSTQKKLEKLASDLDESHATVATRLRELSAAIGGDASAEDWAATDLQQVIHPEAIAEGIKARAVPATWLRVFEWLRNVLIFAPLVLTWLGISQATDRYQVLLSHNGALITQPFLLLWEQGFNNTLPAPFILSHLAFWDFLILAAILLLTGMVNWLYSINNAQAEKEADQLREEMTAALGEASLCLAAVQRTRRLQLQQQPKDIEAVVRLLFDVAKEFKRTTDEFLAEMAAERQQRGSLNDFQQVLAQLSKDMVSAANTMKQSNIDLTSIIRDISGPIKEIPALVLAAGRAVADLHTMASSLEKLVTDQTRWWQATQTTLTTKLDGLLQTQQRIGQEQKQAEQDLQTMLTTSLDRAFTDQQGFEQALYKMLDTSMQQFINEQKLLGHSLIDTADTLEETAKDFSAQVKSIDEFVKAQEKILAALEQQKVAQKSITEQMMQTSAETSLILKTVRDSAPELRSMTIDINKFVSALQAIPQALEGDLLLPLKHYSNAAAKIDTGSEVLEKAALALHYAADRLNGGNGATVRP
jgi:hypothetical protein